VYLRGPEPVQEFTTNEEIDLEQIEEITISFVIDAEQRFNEIYDQHSFVRTLRRKGNRWINLLSRCINRLLQDSWKAEVVNTDEWPMSTNDKVDKLGLWLFSCSNLLRTNCPTPIETRAQAESGRQKKPTSTFYQDSMLLAVANAAINSLVECYDATSYNYHPDWTKLWNTDWDDTHLRQTMCLLWSISDDIVHALRVLVYSDLFRTYMKLQQYLKTYTQWRVRPFLEWAPTLSYEEREGLRAEAVADDWITICFQI